MIERNRKMIEIIFPEMAKLAKKTGQHSCDQTNEKRKQGA